MLISATIDFNFPPGSNSGPSHQDGTPLCTSPPDKSTNAMADTPLADPRFYNNGPFDSNIWYDAGNPNMNAPVTFTTANIPLCYVSPASDFSQINTNMVKTG
jgi:hypothetical protein